MPNIVIPVYFDYASTLCYIAWRIVSELERELEFEALWKGVPIAMRDHRAKPGRIVTDRERQKVLMVAAETGIQVAMPPAWLDSTAALAGAELALQVAHDPPCDVTERRGVIEINWNLDFPHRRRS